MNTVSIILTYSLGGNVVDIIMIVFELNSKVALGILTIDDVRNYMFNILVFKQTMQGAAAFNNYFIRNRYNHFGITIFS